MKAFLDWNENWKGERLKGLKTETFQYKKSLTFFFSGKCI